MKEINNVQCLLILEGHPDKQYFINDVIDVVPIIKKLLLDVKEIPAMQRIYRLCYLRNNQLVGCSHPIRLCNPLKLKHWLILHVSSWIEDNDDSTPYVSFCLKDTEITCDDTTSLYSFSGEINKLLEAFYKDFHNLEETNLTIIKHYSNGVSDIHDLSTSMDIEDWRFKKIIHSSLRMAKLLVDEPYNLRTGVIYELCLSDSDKLLCSFTDKTKLLDFLASQKEDGYKLAIIKYKDSAIEYCSTIYFQKGDNYKQYLERSIKPIEGRNIKKWKQILNLN